MESTENVMYHYRSDAFRLLSATFYPPDRQVFLEENLCTNLADVFARLCPEAASHCREMDEALRKSSSDDMQVEHAALFVGPFELLAPPYGSIYIEGKHELMGDSTVEVQRMYRQAGLDLEEKEVPDHIALELEFAGYLARKVYEQRLSEHGIDEQSLALYNRFVKGTLARWVPEFCQRITLESKHPFYLSLARCLEVFLLNEEERLAPVTATGCS